MPAGSGDVGVSVNVVAGDAVCVNVRGEPAGHSRLKALADAVTLSLKLMTMVELTETLVAPLAGVVLLTLGAVSPPPHGATVVAVFRGAGVPLAKSALLLSVSVQPAPARDADVVLAERRGRTGSLETVRGRVPIADEIDDARRSGRRRSGSSSSRHERDLAGAVAPSRCVPLTSGVGGTIPHGAPGTAGRLLHEVVLPRLKRDVRQVRPLPRGASRRSAY